jgi:predicted Zn-dependent peptidase
MTNPFYDETQVNDGPLVVTHSMPEAQSVALGVFVDVGSRDEPEAQAGITHALEHMLFKGTKQMDVHVLAEKLDELGGNANAFTSRERTCFHLHVLHEHWQEALSLLTSMIREPALPEAEWQREREVIYAEMAMVEDSPEEWIMDRHLAALFPDHALGRTVLGTHEALGSFSTADLSGYLQHWYRPPRLLISAAGRIAHAELIAEIESLDWTQRGNVSEQAVSARISCDMQTGIQALERDGEQAQLVLSFPGIPITSPQRPTAWLANQILGGGMSSYLFREIREKRGLAYSVGSHLSMLTDMGAWSVSCGMEPSRGAECVDVLCNVLAGFVDQMNEEELLRAKRQLEVQFRMGLDSVEGQMLYLGSRLDEKQLNSPLQWLELMHSVDMDQLRLWSEKQLSQGILWSVAAPKQALSGICDNIRPC